jgi:hypothetical protein
MLLRLVPGLLGRLLRRTAFLESAVVGLTAISACATPRADPEVRGLWDAHSHLSWYGEAALDSLLKYGVAGVRDVGGDAIQLRSGNAAAIPH